MGDTGVRCPGCACSFPVVGGGARADAGGGERCGAAVSRGDESAGGRDPSGGGGIALWGVAQDGAHLVEPLSAWWTGGVGRSVASAPCPSVAGAGSGGGGDR